MFQPEIGTPAMLEPNVPPSQWPVTAPAESGTHTPWLWIRQAASPLVWSPGTQAARPAWWLASATQRPLTQAIVAGLAHARLSGCGAWAGSAASRRPPNPVQVLRSPCQGSSMAKVTWQDGAPARALAMARALLRSPVSPWPKMVTGYPLGKALERQTVVSGAAITKGMTLGTAPASPGVNVPTGLTRAKRSTIPPM